ncbi:MAG: type I DNA topoisomerase [Anaerolineae bacterium]|nr:type I DNA topoisomerase [Anaerolineae bacterium]
MADEHMVGYCVKCREKRPISGAQAVFLGASHRPATQGTCPECGTKIVRFGATPAHEELDPARHTVETRATQERKAHGPRMVIVESPAKARTVGRFLGRGYSVEASVGHIRDLPSNRMGVDIEHDFQPRYVIPVKKKEVVDKLRHEASKASEVYLATDPDREGEAIAWHLKAALMRELRGIPVHRVEFHEITQQAVAHAFGHPRPIDELRVDSQQARRILDRVVGFTLSPLLRDKLGRRGLSAGRVQSVTLRLICEREREIEAFVPVEYWTIEAELQKLAQDIQDKAPGIRGDARPFTARLFKIRGEDPDLKNQADAQAVVDDLEGAEYIVEAVTRRERRRNPAPPFMTSTMQQEASRKLRFSAGKTMAIAQALYEGKDVGGGERTGLITYMRTDSLNVATSAQEEARTVIRERYGPGYLPEKPPVYKSRAKGAQEAHEAIRPTGVSRAPESLKEYLSRDEYRLYTLIWQRFIASQMAPAILNQTSVDIVAGPRGASKPYLFRATGSVIKFMGFLAVYEEGREEEDETEEGEGIDLPSLAQGEMLALLRLIPAQHFTQPPPRYTDASLIRALEENGIGRPSTYAPTLQTLLARHYIAREQKRLVPTPLGFTVNDLLVEFFPDVLDVGFTADMEEKLDAIATGEVEWVPMLRHFYAPFSARVDVARAEMPEVTFEPEPTGELCPECGKPLLIRLGRYGKFIGCSGWPTCRYTQPIPLPDVVCPLCGGAVIERRTRKGRRFWGCANYRADDETSCPWTTWKEPQPESE